MLSVTKSRANGIMNLPVSIDHLTMTRVVEILEGFMSNTYYSFLGGKYFLFYV